MEALKGLVIRILRVPPEPPQPFGDEDSLMVFRAAPNYFKYKLITWAIGYIIGTIVLLGMCGGGAIGIFSSNLFGGATPIVGTIILILAVMAYIIYSIFSYLMLRLDYEMRWYKVTDRSIRIREGVLFVREMTLTNVNVQNISITQGPLERYFGISNLKVQTAGGGGSMEAQGNNQNAGFLNMHEGFFRGVDNAEEIQKIVRERLKISRDAGLGDHDDDEIEVTKSASVDYTAVKNVAEDVWREAHEYRKALQAFLQKS